MIILLERGVIFKWLVKCLILQSLIGRQTRMMETAPPPTVEVCSSNYSDDCVFFRLIMKIINDDPLKLKVCYSNYTDNNGWFFVIIILIILMISDGKDDEEKDKMVP